MINLLVFSAIFRNNVNNSGHNSNHWKKLSERMQSVCISGSFTSISPAENDPGTNPEDGFRVTETGGNGDTNGENEPVYEEVKNK